MSNQDKIYCGRFAAVQQVKVRGGRKPEFDQWDKRDKIWIILKQQPKPKKERKNRSFVFYGLILYKCNGLYLCILEFVYIYIWDLYYTNQLWRPLTSFTFFFRESGHLYWNRISSLASVDFFCFCLWHTFRLWPDLSFGLDILYKSTDFQRYVGRWDTNFAVQHIQSSAIGPLYKHFIRGSLFTHQFHKASSIIPSR